MALFFISKDNLQSQASYCQVYTQCKNLIMSVRAWTLRCTLMLLSRCTQCDPMERLAASIGKRKLLMLTQIPEHLGKTFAMLYSVQHTTIKIRINKLAQYLNNFLQIIFKYRYQFFQFSPFFTILDDLFCCLFLLSSTYINFSRRHVKSVVPATTLLLVVETVRDRKAKPSRLAQCGVYLHRSAHRARTITSKIN